MYHESMKRKFMDQIHDYALQAIFNFTGVFEENAGHDLGDFSETEIRELLGRFFDSCWGRRTDLNRLCEQLNKYLMWYQESCPGATVAQSYDLQIWQFFKPAFEVKHDKFFYFSADDIYNIGQMLDDRLYYILCAMYEGLRGEDGKGILTLSMRDVDMENLLVRTEHGDVHISTQMAKAIRAAYDGKITQYRQHVYASNVSAIDMDRVIKFRSQPDGMTQAAIKASMRTLFNAIREACGFPLLTINNVVMSGFVSDIALLYDLSDTKATIRPTLNDDAIMWLGQHYGIDLDEPSKKSRRAKILDEFIDAYREKIVANTTDKSLE